MTRRTPARARRRPRPAAATGHQGRERSQRGDGARQEDRADGDLAGEPQGRGAVERGQRPVAGQRGGRGARRGGGGEPGVARRGVGGAELEQGGGQDRQPGGRAPPGRRDRDAREDRAEGTRVALRHKRRGGELDDHRPRPAPQPVARREVVVDAVRARRAVELDGRQGLAAGPDPQWPRRPGRHVLRGDRDPVSAGRAHRQHQAGLRLRPAERAGGVALDTVEAAQDDRPRYLVEGEVEARRWGGGGVGQQAGEDDRQPEQDDNVGGRAPRRGGPHLPPAGADRAPSNAGSGLPPPPPAPLPATSRDPRSRPLLLRRHARRLLLDRAHRRDTPAPLYGRRRAAPAIPAGAN